jgi:hypothetical protein
MLLKNTGAKHVLLQYSMNLLAGRDSPPPRAGISQGDATGDEYYMSKSPECRHVALTID